jgi:hypothetical protein
MERENERRAIEVERKMEREQADARSCKIE